MVVSMSLWGAVDDTEAGYADNIATINTFVDTMAAGGDMLFVAAAGNSGDSGKQFPSLLNSVMGVTQVDNTYRVADSATFNADVDLAAPGTDILTAISPSIADPQVGCACWCVPAGVCLLGWA